MTQSTLAWPDEKKLAVMITVALELWTPGRWPSYAPMAAAWPLPGVPDTHSMSWCQYGATTGIWRLLDILAAHNIRATAGVNALVADCFPDTVLALRDAGHEVAAHSYAQDVLPPQLDREAERENILRCTERLDHLTGIRPTGWMSPRATATADTAQLLTEAGYLWSGDYNDRELPYVVSTAHGPLVAIMHSDYSDIRGAMAGPRAYRDISTDLLDYLLAAPGPGIFNLTIHAHVGGRPLLATMFDQILDHVGSSADIWVATHQQVAQHVLQLTRQLERER